MQLNFDLSDRPGYGCGVAASGIVERLSQGPQGGNLDVQVLELKKSPPTFARTPPIGRTDIVHQAMQATTKPSATERPGSETSRLVIETTCVVCLQPCEGKKACACSFMHQQCAEAYKQTVRHMPCTLHDPCCPW